MQICCRPMLVMAAVSGLGLASRQIPATLIFGLCVIALVIRSRMAAVAVVMLLLGWIVGPARVTPHLAEPHPFSGDVFVCSLPVLGVEGYSLLVESDQTRYWLRLEGKSNFNKGDTLWIEGQLKPLSEAAGSSRGATGSLHADHIRLLKTGPAFWKFATLVSTNFRDWALESLSPASAKIIIAITFNQTDQLLADDWETLQQSGLIHIVSASGFHVLIVGVAIAWTLKWIALPRPWVLFITALVLLLYAAAAGFQSPVVRAVVMLVSLEFAYWWRKCPDGLSALGFAVLVNLALDSYIVFELGFQLSVLSVAGLAILSPQFFGAYSFENSRSWKEAVKTPIVAQFVTTPLTTSKFGYVSLLAIPLNIFLSPLIAYLTVGSLGLWVGAMLARPIADIFTPFAIDKPTEFFLWFVEWVTSWRGATLGLPQWSNWMTAMSLLAMVLLWRPKREAHGQ